MKKILILLLFSFLLIIGGCVENIIGYDGELIINTIDENGNKIDNVKIMVNGETKYTDKNGQVIFTNLKNQKYLVNAEKKGYVLKEKKEILINKDTMLNLTLLIKKGIKFQILDEIGDPIEEASIYIEKIATLTNLGTKITDSNGEISLDEKSKTAYKLTVIKEGYEDKTVSFDESFDGNEKIVLTAKKGVKITIKDESNVAIENAKVFYKYYYIENGVINEKNDNSLTDSNGEVNISNALWIKGITIDAVVKTGYISKSSSVSVQDKGVKEIILASTGIEANKIVQLTASEPAGEKKIYIYYEIGTQDITSFKMKIKVDSNSYSAGLTGGKIYAKNGDSWTWNEGEWTNSSADTWVEFVYAPSSLTEVHEIGVQLYGGSSSSALTNGVIQIKDIEVNGTLLDLNDKNVTDKIKTKSDTSETRELSVTTE
jgi:hypothetical protein